MRYKKKDYAIVNEFIRDGVTYQAWRQIDNPKKCLITYEGEVVETEKLKLDWEGIIHG